MTSAHAPIPVLFTHYGDEWIRGSERCLLDQLQHLDRRQFRPVVWCNARTLARAVRALGITVHLSHFPILTSGAQDGGNIIGWAGNLRRGLRLIDRHGIKLIHANSGAPMQWLNLIARARRLPLVNHLHSPYTLRDRWRLGLHHGSVSVGVSEATIAALRSDGLADERMRVIANGIDCDRLLQRPVLPLREQLGLAEDDLLLISVGSLIHRKGMDTLVRAVGRLHGQGIPAHLAIVGAGPEREALGQLILQRGLGGHVHILGEHYNPVGLMRGGADVFVSGAREEAFGLVLAEAGLAGLPCVAPRVGGIPAVIDHARNGLLVEPDNVAALAHALRLLHLAPGLRRTMGQQGHRYVREHFDIRQPVRRFEALYHEMLATPAHQLRWFSHWSFGLPLLRAVRRFGRLLASRPLQGVQS